MVTEGQDIYREIERLLRAVIPSVSTCIDWPRVTVGDEAGRKAVTDTAAWFLPGVDLSPLAGHELSTYALGIVLDEHVKPAAAGLPPHRFDALYACLPMLVENLYSAHSRSRHRSGWASAMPLTREGAETLLRGAVQHIVSSAVYALTGDARTMYKGQQRVPGRELDLDALLGVLAEDMGDAPTATASSPR